MTSKKHKVIVCGRDEFPEQVKRKPGWAYISISATPECAEFWLGDKSESEHHLPSGPDVLNLEFDDLEEDRTYKGHTFKAITQEQAEEIFMFVEDHLDKDILIHCRACKSRSQGVFRYILDTYPDYYEECEENKINPCLTPNIEVVRKCKRAYIEENPFVLGDVRDREIDLIGKYVIDSLYTKPVRKEMQFLLGIVEDRIDYYYLLINEKGEINYKSYCFSIRVINNPPIAFMDNMDLDEIARRIRDCRWETEEQTNIIKLWKNLEERLG